MENLAKVFLVFSVLMTVFISYLLFVVLPVSLYTDAECLRNGYPKAHVTIGLSRYCSTLDGAVTVQVTPQ